MSYGKQNGVGCVLPEFTVDDLGTSFKVVLINSVICSEGEKGKEFLIPDYQGLVKQIAVSRAAHPVKLKGGDIKFLRKNLGLRSKELASKLDISPEHLSRCEAGTKILSPNSERVLRSLVLCEALYIFRKAIEDVEGPKANSLDKLTGLIDRLHEVMGDFKIQSTYDANEELIFHFRHVPMSKPAANDGSVDAAPEWLDEAA